MKPKPSWPVAVLHDAHLAYPRAVALRGLYGVAFFGHGRPRDLDHKETTESVWRELCRASLRAYCERGE